MISKFLPVIRQAGLVLVLALLTFTSGAQDQDVDISKMGHMKLRAYLKENGLKTKSGQVVKIGDVLIVGKGTMPDKRFAFIYQSQTGFGTTTSFDGSVKGYLNSSATGRKAIVKAFMTSGMCKGEYTIFIVVGVGEPVNYWIELEDAIQSGEIILPKK